MSKLTGLAVLLVAAAATDAAAQVVIVTTPSPAPAPAPTPAPTPAPAPAAPAATAPATTAPQNYEWNQVNHINGQLVKVGETNEYLKSFRRTNVAVNPIGWIAGFWGVSVSHAVGEHWVVRGDVDYIDPVDDEHTHIWQGSLSAPLYLKRAYHGPFLEPGVAVRASRHHNYDGYYDYNTGTWTGGESDSYKTQFGPEVLFGWHATWDGGFNVAAAIGAGRNLNASDSDYSDDKLFVDGYFRVGYAF